MGRLILTKCVKFWNFHPLSSGLIKQTKIKQITYCVIYSMRLSVLDYLPAVTPSISMVTWSKSLWFVFEDVHDTLEYLFLCLSSNLASFSLIHQFQSFSVTVCKGFHCLSLELSWVTSPVSLVVTDHTTKLNCPVPELYSKLVTKFFYHLCLLFKARIKCHWLYEAPLPVSPTQKLGKYS